MEEMFANFFSMPNTRNKVLANLSFLTKRGQLSNFLLYNQGFIL